MKALLRVAGRQEGSATATVVIAVATVALLLIPVLMISAGSRNLSAAASSCTRAGTPQPPPSTVAQSIPGNYLALFEQTGRTYGISWPVLAGIGEVEGSDGANDGPSSAGAIGPMQFLPSTWQIYGNGGDIMNPADAIPAAARLLLANGAPADIPAAIFAYNHSPDYVSEVLSWANTYAEGGYTVRASQQGNCTLAAVRQSPSAIAAQIISYAMAQIGKPYIWGGTGPAGFDCSGLIYAAYRSVGIILPRTTFAMWDLSPHIPERHAEPGDIVFFNTGPGTSPDHPGHAGLVIGNGQMVVASCTICGPIATVSYTGNPTLVGFVHPLADLSINARLNNH